MGTASRFSIDIGCTRLPVPLEHGEPLEHGPNAFAGSFWLAGPANQNSYLAPITVPPSASPARHSVPSTIEVFAGELNAHVAMLLFALRCASPSAPISAPPDWHVLITNV